MLDVYIGALIVAALIIGYINEDKFIRFEHRLWLIIKHYHNKRRTGGDV